MEERGATHERSAGTSGGPPSGRPAEGVIHAVIALLSAIWGSTYFVIREGLRDLPPFTAAAARFALAGAVFTLIAPALARREGGARPSLRLSLAFGLANIALSYSLIYWCGRVLPSGLVSVLWSTFPLMMAASGHLFLGERLAPRQVLGFVVGFLGIAALFATDLRALGPEALPAGALLLLSPLVSTAGNTLVKKHGERTSSLLLNRNGIWIGCAVIAALALALEGDSAPAWTPRALASVVYLALAGTVLTFGLYYWAMRYAPAYRLSTIAYLTPLLALTLGTLAGGEPFTAFTALGSALILGGVALVLGGAAGARPRRGAGLSPPAEPGGGGSTPR
jgi:drug/metabolite transporter (DMT)-like permease